MTVRRQAAQLHRSLPFPSRQTNMRELGPFHLFFSYVGNRTGSRNAQYKIRPHLPLERAKEFKHEPKRLEFAQDKYWAASTKYTPKYESPASLRLATRVSRAHHAADSSQTSLSTKRHCTLASSCARIRARARSSRPRTPLASI